MASSSAKALRRDAGENPGGFHRVSMASSSAKALRLVHAMTSVGAGLGRFNGLLIGQGTAATGMVGPTSSSSEFQWPPHRPRHCGST